MKERSTQDNLHLVRDILEGLKDDSEAALVNLDQDGPSVLGDGSGDCRIHAGVTQMDQYDVLQPQAVV